MRHRKPYPRRILDDGNSFIRDVEEYHGGTQDAPAADDVNIEDIRYTHKSEDADLLANPFEADGTGQLLLNNRTEYTRDVVRHNKSDKGIKQIVKAAEDLSDKDTDARRIQAYCQNLIHHQPPLLSSIY